MWRTITVWAVVFLVVLRLSIGWQFLLEGLQKYRANYLIGPTETSKPFSSEGYFRGSTGPFAGLIKGQLPDTDEQLLAVLRFPVEKDPRAVPQALAQRYDGYYEAFLAAYPLDEKQLDQAQEVVKQAKSNFTSWLALGNKEVERKVGNTTAKMTLSTRQRVEEYERALKEHREFENKRWQFLRDVDRDDQALARARVIELRGALQKDVDAETEKHLRKALADVVRAKIDETLVLPTDPGEVLALLTLATDPAATASPEYPLAKYMPPALDSRWTAYYEALQTNLKATGKAQQEVGRRLLDRARDRTVRWLLDSEVQGTRAASLFGLSCADQPLVVFTSAVARNTNPGPPDTLLVALSEKNAEAGNKISESLRTSIKDLDNQLKDGLEEMLTESQKTVTPPRTPEGWSFIKTLDSVTICVITGAGLLLMLGLFTRIGCIVAAGFLFLTFWSAPPFPWLPLPPGTEGNPIYVNKNLIEFFALLALAGTASGRWFGIDALLARWFGKPEPEEATTEPVREQADCLEQADRV